MFVLICLCSLLYEARNQDTFGMSTLACNVFNFYLTMLKLVLNFTDKPDVASRVFKPCSSLFLISLGNTSFVDLRKTFCKACDYCMSTIVRHP